MSILYHPDQSTLLAYSAGTLSEGFSLVMAAHLHYCKDCRQSLSKTDDFAGYLLSDIKKETLAKEKFNTLWNKIETNYSKNINTNTNVKKINKKDYPSVLLPYINNGLEHIQWKLMAPGIHQSLVIDIDCDPGAVRFLKIQPGIKIPQHTHNGSELTLVLQGSYEDEMGFFQKGDISDLDSSHCHQPSVNSSVPCICLVATDQKLKFINPFTRLFQPLFGI